MTSRTFRARLARACRVIAGTRDVPTAEVQRLADRARLLAIPPGEARVYRAVANNRASREASRIGRPYVARRSR